MPNTEQIERRSDIQSIKDVVVPGDEYYRHELHGLTSLDYQRLDRALDSLCNLDYLIYGICDVTGLTVYKTI